MPCRSMSPASARTLSKSFTWPIGTPASLPYVGTRSSPRSRISRTWLPVSTCAIRSMPKRPESRPTPDKRDADAQQLRVVERATVALAPAEADVAHAAARGGATAGPAGEVVVDEPGAAAAREPVSHHRVEPLAVPAGLERRGCRRRAASAPLRRRCPAASAARRSSRAAVPALIEVEAVASEPVDDLLFIEPFAEQPPRCAKDFPGRVGAGEKELLRPRVRRGEQQRAARRLPVPPGATRLLIVGLDASRQLGMHDEPDVRLVDPHAEGVRGGDDVDAAGEKVVLHPRALFVRQPRVVAPGAEPLSREHVRPELHRLAGGGVHDSRRSDLGDEPRERSRLLLPAPAGLDRERQVGSLEAGDEIERVLEAELGGDVGADVAAWRWP